MKINVPQANWSLEANLEADAVGANSFSSRFEELAASSDPSPSMAVTNSMASSTSTFFARPSAPCWRRIFLRISMCHRILVHLVQCASAFVSLITASRSEADGRDERREAKSTESLGGDGVEVEFERVAVTSSEDVRIHARPSAHQCLSGSVSVPPRVYASC